MSFWAEMTAIETTFTFEGFDSKKNKVATAQLHTVASPPGTINQLSRPQTINLAGQNIVRIEVSSVRSAVHLHRVCGDKLSVGGEALATGTAFSGATPVRTFTIDGQAGQITSVVIEGDALSGLVFRYRDGNNYYRFSMDHNRQYRRVVRVVNGIHTILAQDDFTYELQFDYLITIEAMGDALRVYQDGAQLFDVADETHRNGSIGLYCYDNAVVRFNDVRVDDFRQTAPVVYRFQFTTSLFANFFHHLHSYQDETWRATVAEMPSAYPAMSQAVEPIALLTDGEARAYETLATAVLGPAARQNHPEVQVTRVEIDGAPLAFLVQSPEPIDWLRTEIALSRTSFARTEPALPAKAKLAAVNFAANRIDIDSVVVLLREPMDLSAYRIEGRLVAWPLSPGSGVVIDAQTIPGGLLQSWATYRSFEAEKKLPAGTILKVQPGDGLSINPAGVAGVDAESVASAHRILYSVELRLVAPDGEIVHSRHFLPDDDYVSESLKVLRKADGTGFFMVKLDVALSVVPLSLDQYRLKLTYHRHNKARFSTSQTLSQAGNDADEIVTLDIPLQTQG